MKEESWQRREIVKATSGWERSTQRENGGACEMYVRHTWGGVCELDVTVRAQFGRERGRARRCGWDAMHQQSTLILDRRQHPLMHNPSRSVMSTKNYRRCWNLTSTCILKTLKKGQTKSFIDRFGYEGWLQGKGGGQGEVGLLPPPIVGIEERGQSGKGRRNSSLSLEQLSDSNTWILKPVFNFWLMKILSFALGLDALAWSTTYQLANLSLKLHNSPRASDLVFGYPCQIFNLIKQL